MKHLHQTLSLLTLAALLAGCAGTPQRVAVNTLYTVEHTTTAAYDGFIDGVVSGTVATNGVPRVARAFNQFQGSFLIALDAVQFNTNALAPASLVTESQDVINLIATFTKGK